MSNPFAGTWTYRSFHNNPKPVQSFDEIRLAQADLVLNEAGPDWLEGKLSFGSAYLEMKGVSTCVEGRWQLRMRGSGVDKTATAGWIYDYICEMAAEWPAGDGQRPAIVGTVIRTAYHEPDRDADLSYSFVAVRREPNLAVVKPLPKTVVEHFADREHRLHHAVWHALRNSWFSLDKDQQTAVRGLHWEPPRHARMNTANDMFKPLVLNHSGEDFLYFHREMVWMFRQLMASAGEAPVNWQTIPRPGASGDEVPPAWRIQKGPVLERRIRALKTDEFYWSRMRWWDQHFKDPTYLSTLALGELGSLIDFSVHGDMHMRWSAPPRDPETNALLPTGRGEADTNERWDNPKYDWLGEFYSSHVNPFFWRLHGWIDDRITDWYEAHEARHPGQIEKYERNGLVWFKAGGRWVGVDKPWVWPDHLMGHGAHHHGHHGGHDGHNGGHGGGHGGHGGGHGGHGTDPELRAKRIASLGKVLDVLFNRERKLEPAAKVFPEASRISFIFGE